MPETYALDAISISLLAAPGAGGIARRAGDAPVCSWEISFKICSHRHARQCTWLPMAAGAFLRALAQYTWGRQDTSEGSSIQKRVSSATVYLGLVGSLGGRGTLPFAPGGFSLLHGSLLHVADLLWHVQGQAKAICQLWSCMPDAW